MSLPVFEPGDTKLFTWVASLAPNAAPRLVVYGVDNSTVIASITSQQSDTTHYWTLFTMPTSEGHYRARWHAQKTSISSAYDIITPLLFRVQAAKP